jgi:endonuclease/exonuclease/phosphatase family metal-dependent hydrolase
MEHAMGRLNLHRPVSAVLLLAVAAAAAQSIDARLEQLRNDPNVSFGTAPSDDLKAVPDGVFALVSWNIQVGGAAPTAGAARPPQVQAALAALFAGTYQVLAAEEVSSTAHAEKLRQLLPGATSDWSVSFTDTTSDMDNGFWLRTSVALRADDVILHTGARDPAARVLIDADKAKHPPRIGHFTVGDFDFTLIAVHLTFEGGSTTESAREFRHLLDFLDAYFSTAGHDPDVIIAGDFNTPSRLSGQTGQNGVTLDGLLDADPRFQVGERRFVVTVHEPTSRRTTGVGKGQPAENYDHFILSADCLEELVQARRVDTTVLLDRSGELQPDGSRRLTSDHFPIVAFFRTAGPEMHKDLP